MIVISVQHKATNWEMIQSSCQFHRNMRIGRGLTQLEWCNSTNLKWQNRIMRWLVLVVLTKWWLSLSGAWLEPMTHGYIRNRNRIVQSKMYKMLNYRIFSRGSILTFSILLQVKLYLWRIRYLCDKIMDWGAMEIHFNWWQNSMRNR